MMTLESDIPISIEIRTVSISPGSSFHKALPVLHHYILFQPVVSLFKHTLHPGGSCVMLRVISLCVRFRLILRLFFLIKPDNLSCALIGWIRVLFLLILIITIWVLTNKKLGDKRATFSVIYENPIIILETKLHWLNWNISGPHKMYNFIRFKNNSNFRTFQNYLKA